MKLIRNWQNTSHFCQNELSLELSWHILQALNCTGWNNCSILKQTTPRMEVLFLITFFRLYPGLKMSFENNVVRKNLFLSACFCWYSRLSLLEKDQKLKFGGTIGYGDSYLEFHFVILKSLDYTQYYMMLLEHCKRIVAKVQATLAWLGEDQNHVCLVTWLLYCLYVKLFLNSISTLSIFEAVYLALY